jgi:acetyltransferase-like isoleucine patch superfamily enzyme
VKTIFIKYKFLKKFFPNALNSTTYFKYLREKGINVGRYTKFYNPGTINIDIDRPHLLKIGAYCKITAGVTILTHDYSRSVLRKSHNVILPDGEKTDIGNNVFIGINSIILMGSVIGENSIVGAGSIVKGKFPSNVVIAGNPARIIMTLDEYFKRKIEKNVENIMNYINSFLSFHGRLPRDDEFGLFSILFDEHNNENATKKRIFFKVGGDFEDEVLQTYLSTSPIYNGYKELIDEFNRRKSNEKEI